MAPTKRLFLSQCEGFAVFTRHAPNTLARQFIVRLELSSTTHTLTTRPQSDVHQHGVRLLARRAARGTRVLPGQVTGGQTLAAQSRRARSSSKCARHPPTSGSGQRRPLLSTWTIMLRRRGRLHLLGRRRAAVRPAPGHRHATDGTPLPPVPLTLHLPHPHPTMRRTAYLWPLRAPSYERPPTHRRRSGRTSSTCLRRSWPPPCTPSSEAAPTRRCAKAST